MTRNRWVLSLLLAGSVGVAACSPADDDTRAGEVTEADGDVTTVTGCLTAASDDGAYVLTANRSALTSGALYSGSGEVPTYTYELVPGAADLRPHVGREVEITGRLDEERKDDVEVDQEKEIELPERRVGGDKVSPAIETDTEMDIQVRRLHVASVKPTGGGCALERGQ